MSAKPTYDEVVAAYNQLVGEKERYRTALNIGLQLAESGAHGSGPDCPTCHFVREARKAWGLSVPKIKQSLEN